MRVAVLITCHNRCAKTITCLEALFQNVLPAGYSLEVFLVDDGSTDGTEQAVRNRYPQITIIRGDGNLYWNGGMRLAFTAAMENNFDYYLWLNDDTFLYKTAIERLIKTEVTLTAIQGEHGIVVGSTQGEIDGLLTYGGVSRLHKWRATKFTMIQPVDVPVQCETMNGNCVLIPNVISHVVGNLEPKFTHAMGDTDYGLRAHRYGFRVWVMPGFAGICSHNSLQGTYNDSSLSVGERLRKIMQPKGLPVLPWYIFTWRHAGFFWPIFWIWPYAKIIFKWVLRK